MANLRVRGKCLQLDTPVPVRSTVLVCHPLIVPIFCDEGGFGVDCAYRTRSPPYPVPVCFVPLRRDTDIRPRATPVEVPQVCTNAREAQANWEDTICQIHVNLGATVTKWSQAKPPHTVP